MPSKTSELISMCHAIEARLKHEGEVDWKGIALIASSLARKARKNEKELVPKGFTPTYLVQVKQEDDSWLTWSAYASPAEADQRAYIITARRQQETRIVKTTDEKVAIVVREFYFGEKGLIYTR